jgi:hypothetical protein
MGQCLRVRGLFGLSARPHPLWLRATPPNPNFSCARCFCWHFAYTFNDITGKYYYSQTGKIHFHFSKIEPKTSSRNSMAGYIIQNIINNFFIKTIDLISVNGMLCGFQKMGRRRNSMNAFHSS